MPVKDYYQKIIREIMSQYSVEPGYVSPIVPADAKFECVLRHTDYYVGKGNDERQNARPHYRYRRYREMIQLTKVPEGRVAHVDIGCGAGLFSWVLLDWATENSVGHSRVNLYGFDHCLAMMQLAGMVRDELGQNMAGYPDLDYYNDIDILLDQLSDNRCGNTDYIITFGHVLVQAHTPDAIDSFTQIILRIRDLMDEQSTCSLIAVDADNEPVQFADGWDLLLESLKRNRICYDRQDVPVTAINNSKRAKWALLYSA